jgi:hypothetical protein
METKTKNRKPRKEGLFFSVTGEGMTEQIRDSWVSDIPKHALKICREGLGMTTEQALEVITGKKKLTGDTRYDDGLDWTDDNTTEVCGIKLSVEVMVSRLENNWINASEAINTFNSVTDFVDDDDYEYNMKVLNGYKEKLSGILEQIECVYPLVKKSMKDLPYNKIRSAQQIKKYYKTEHPEEFEQSIRLTDVESDFDKKFGKVMRNTQMSILNMKKHNEEKEEKIDENDITRPFYTGMGTGGRFYIVHTPAERCKEEGMHSGWLLPDGTFLAGDSAWIHRGILEELSERNFFADKNYGSGEDDVQDNGNWIKVSGSDWMIWEHKHQPTKEQVEFIIEYTSVVEEKTYFKNGGFNLIHISVFAKLLDGITQFDSSEMAEESKKIIYEEREIENKNNEELGDFPTVDEVSEIDPLSTPFFIPDVAFVKWLIKYANGRLMIDCGAGTGYLTALITKLGGKCIAIEPMYTMERKMFWVKQRIHFHVFYEKSETASIIKTAPDNKALLLFARPCHSSFVYDTIQNNMNEGMEALYIGHKHNHEDDLGDLPFEEIKHEGTSKNREIVLSIKK